MRDAFSSYHPAVNLAYFMAVIGFSMFITHPAAMIIAGACALSYALYLSKPKISALAIVLPMIIFTALLNPLFNNQGVTILAYLPNGNPLTLESIIFGPVAALMLVTVIAWFACFNAVMSSDKFVYLFGRAVPALSLILAMSLRLVPRFLAQAKIIAGAQKCIGRGVTDGSILRRAKHGIKILSIMLTWALENAVETADSMKSRGYGLPGRTAFAIFKFARRDFYALAYIAACAAYILAGALAGGLSFRYFPAITGAWEPRTFALLAAYLALCAAPLIINIREDRKWAASK